MDYTKTIELDLPFDEAVPAVKACFAAQGFGTLTEIDVQATLETKLGKDIGPYLILGTCNPQLAHQAIGIDPAIGALLPCNVVVRRHQGRTLVQALDPAIMAAVPGRDELEPIATEAARRVEAALHQLELDNP
jgi:uncharacterized protein (DUF302 family)